MSAASESSFNTVASDYDKYRPTYVDELYRIIFGYMPLNETSTALEIGIGTCQASAPILSTGCSLTAVEYGDELSAICREKFRNYHNFSVVTGRFEEVGLPENTFDLVYSATAFHWIPEDIGYPKVLSLLKKGGAFARFANRPYRDKGNTQLACEIDELYDRYYYPFHGKKRRASAEFTEKQASDIAETAAKYGFTDIKYALFRRTRTFSADEYCKLLGTYSDHIAMDEDIRTAFFSEIKNAIDSHGGSITIYDTIDLELARKP